MKKLILKLALVMFAPTWFTAVANADGLPKYRADTPGLGTTDEAGDTPTSCAR